MTQIMRLTFFFFLLILIFSCFKFTSIGIKNMRDDANELKSSCSQVSGCHSRWNSSLTLDGHGRGGLHDPGLMFK